MFEVSLELNQAPSITISGFDTLKEQVEELTEKMQSVKVTADNIQASKKMLAEINKQRNALDTQRKNIEKEVLKPLTEIKSQTKEINTMIDVAEKVVRDQIKQLEQEEKDQRKAVLAEEFDRLSEYYELISGITFEMVLEMKWLNKSTSEKRAKQELQDKVNKIVEDYRLILRMVPEDDRVPCVYEFTKNGFNVNQVLDSWKVKQEQLTLLKKEVKADSKKPRPTIAPTNLEQQETFNKTLVIYGRDDLASAIKFMTDNNIHFKQL